MVWCVSDSTATSSNLFQTNDRKRERKKEQTIENTKIISILKCCVGGEIPTHTNRSSIKTNPFETSVFQCTPHSAAFSSVQVQSAISAQPTECVSFTLPLRIFYVKISLVNDENDLWIQISENASGNVIWIRNSNSNIIEKNKITSQISSI